MGCYTWLYANIRDYDRDEPISDFPFIFRVFDYQEDVLTNYKNAVEFIMRTFKNSTNYDPKGPSHYWNEQLKAESYVTYTDQMRGKILFASENGTENLTDPTLTFKRLKEFYKKYPSGIIKFG